MTPFPPSLTGSAQDETSELRPRFDANGLIAAIAQDAVTGEVLMLAWMNAEALQKTIETGRATYWSRSRAALWSAARLSGFPPSCFFHLHCRPPALCPRCARPLPG